MEPFAKVLRLILRYVWSFVIIVLVLAAGRSVLDQLSELDTHGLALARLQHGQTEIAQFISDSSDDITSQTHATVSLSLAAQQSLLDRVTRDIEKLEARPSQKFGVILMLARPDGIEYVKGTIRLEMLKQQRIYLRKLVQETVTIEGKRACKQRLVVRLTEYKEAYKPVKANETRRARLEEDNYFPSWNRASDGYDEYQGLKAEYPELRKRYEAAENTYRDQQAACNAITEPEAPGQFAMSNAASATLLNEIDNAVADLAAKLDKSWLGKVLDPIRSVTCSALWILAGFIVVPLLIKLLFYFVLAPAASRLPSIRIIPNPNAPPIPEPSPSAVSIAIDVGPEEELLVRPDFLQSSSQPAKKQTKWLLNPRIPFASIASEMFALTRIRPEGASATRVVISSQKDPFGEIGVIKVPAGAAVIVQPRSLAGVVKPAGIPVAVSKHWRLSSLHAWLTLQLRYLAFHGPCKLVLKGCRGVRSEEPNPGQPRLINQAATLGFSANLDYKTTRCETFVPYLRGQEDLFNDLFAGGPGRFIYEEIPAVGSKAGVISRGLEGVVDAVLKIFGI